ncbi:MAG: hypothetical protein ACW98W_12650 [Candidatus Hodarchaeales archaeon]
MKSNESKTKITHQKYFDKYQEQINSSGGIFTKKTRERILGIRGLSGRYRTKKRFWVEQGENIQSALRDLALFIETTETPIVDDVINIGSLTPVVEALLGKPLADNAEPDLIRAEIAQLFIQTGFSYLALMKIHMIPSLYERVISEANELSRLLVTSFQPEGKRQSLARVP